MAPLNIRLENFTNLEFINLLNHDIRHDFNYPRFSKTVLVEINNNNEIKLLKAQVGGVTPKKSPTRKISKPLTPTKTTGNLHNKITSKKSYISSHSSKSKSILNEYTKIYNLIQNILETPSFKMEFFETIFITIGFIDKINYDKINNKINYSSIEKAFYESNLASYSDKNFSDDSEEKDLDAFFCIASETLRYLVIDKSYSLEILVTDKYYKMVMTNLWFFRYGPKYIKDFLLSETVKSPSKNSRENSLMETMEIYKKININKCLNNSMDTILEGGVGKYDSNRSERKSSRRRTAPTRLSQGQADKTTTLRSADAQLDAAKRAAAAATEAAATRALNKAAADRADAVQKARRWVDPEGAVNTRFVNQILYIVSSTLHNLLTKFKIYASATTPNTVESLSEDFFDYHHDTILDMENYDYDQKSSSIDDALFTYFKGKVGEAATKVIIPEVEDIIFKEDIDLNRARNTIWTNTMQKKYIINNAAPLEKLWEAAEFLAGTDADQAAKAANNKAANDGTSPTCAVSTVACDPTSCNCDDLYVFCPISSLVDPGELGACAPYNYVQRGREVEDTNINIFSYYPNSTRSITYNLRTTVTPPFNINTYYSLEFKDGGDIRKFSHSVPEDYTAIQRELSIANTYRELCSQLIQSLQGMTGTNPLTATSINSLNPVWTNISNNIDLVNQMVSIILRKSKGDLIQELNAMLNKGGYNRNSTVKYIDATPPTLPIEQWDADGNALRCLLSNDKPSAIRAMFIKLFFPKLVVNKYGFGGFLSRTSTGDRNIFLIKKPQPPLPVTGGRIKQSKLTYKKRTLHNRKGKYTQKAGFTKLGRCYIIPLPNDNLKIILGRRKYVTKNFDINPASKTLIYNVANNPVTKNKCIAVAKYEDRRLKFIKKEQRKTKKVYK